MARYNLAWVQKQHYCGTVPKLVSPADNIRTRHRSRLVLCQHFPLMGSQLSSLQGSPLFSHVLVIMADMDCTWLEFFSKDHGLNPWTLCLILHPGCSAAVSARSNYLHVHSVTSHPDNCVWVSSVKPHRPCRLSHTSLAAPAHGHPSLSPPRWQVQLSSTVRQFLQPISRTRPPLCPKF